jgi:2-oxoglutarate ferredoxin oxidoreductase subunit gamma
MSGIVQIRLGGLGGQGIVLAGILLGHAGIIDGRWVSGANSYGAQARGSACKAEVILSEEPVDFPHILEVDILVAMSQNAYERFVKDVKDGGMVIFDKQLVKPGDSIPVHQPIPATEVAIHEMGNKQVANIVMLGALTALTHVVSKESIEAAIMEHIPTRFRKINLKAVKTGYTLGENSR